MGVSELGIALGAFELSAPFGQGAMASVFRGRHRGTGLPVAIKVMAGQHVRRVEFVNAFRNEVEAVARLHHPGIVRVYDYGEVSPDAALASDGVLEAGTPYLVMDLASEGSLDSAGYPSDWPATKRLLLDLLEALAHAHARGVVHRDLKPGNVLVDERSGVRVYKLTDFGLAHAAPQRGRHSIPAEVTRETMASSGTPPFMAPEQFAGDWRAQGPWTDLYALGCMAYLIVCGEVPFPHDDLQALANAHATEPAPLVRPVMPVPLGFQSWVHTLMSKSLATRFLHAADAAHSLRSVDEALMTPAVAERPPATEALSETGPTHMLTVPLAEPSEPAGFKPPSSTLLDRNPPPLPVHWRREEAVAPSLAAGLGLFGLRTMPLVDRDHERDLLWSALRIVHEKGDPRALVLRGSAGAGKSRLADWIAQRAEEVGGAIVLRASHSALGGSQDGIVAMLLRHMRCEQLEREAFDTRLRDVLARVGVDDPFLRHALIEVLSAREEESTQLFDGAAARPEERHRVLLRLLRLLATDRPLILLLDDVQWGLDALRFARRILFELVEPLNALVLLTVRDEALVSCLLERAELDYLLHDGFASAIELGPLPRADHRQLVERMLGLSSTVVERVAERTDGNPLFATQLVADWVSRGVLVAGDDGLELSAGADDRLPDDIHALCAVRIHEAMRGRSEDDRVALELAAMLGAHVREVEWRAVCRQRKLSPSAKLLADLGRIGILEAASLGSWRFSHGVIRESLERVAKTNGRWENHNLVIATVLRRVEGVHSAELTARIGRYLANAGEQHEAVTLLLEAARGFRLEGDFVQASAVLDERTAFLDAMNIPSPHPHRHEAELLMALVAIDQARLDDAAEAARSAMVSAAEHGWPRIEARAALRLADVASARHRRQAGRVRGAARSGGSSLLSRRP
jgi:serine/threonine protein kinase